MYRPKFVYQPVIFVILTMVAMSLELLDFPPWRRILDAHALWHFSTIALIPFWYSFLIQDAVDDGWRPEKS
jgi:hypothetical protein